MKKFFILAIVSIFIVLFPSTVLASEHKVKAVILVPANRKNLLPKDQEEKIKSAVHQALKTVQQYYADNLLGKTFNFDKNIEIIHLENNLFGNIVQYGTDFIWELNALKHLPYNPNTIYVVWTVGGQATRPAALPIVKGYGGIVGLDSGNLFALIHSDGLSKDKSLGILAHELGHTFGMLSEGYAKWHPCTIETPSECQSNAPQPLPDSSESYEDIMGYNHVKFPNLTLHNSIYNPVVFKAFQSAYLNPTKDPAPKPQVSIAPPMIQTVSPEVAIVEETVIELRGTNFGENLGEVILIREDNRTEKVKVQNINIWSDSSIKIVIPKEAAKYPSLATLWLVQVIKSPGSAGTAKIFLLAKNKPDPSPKLPPIPLSTRLNITCGEDKQPLPNVTLSLVEGQALSKILKEITTNEAGQAIIEHTITQATTQSEFNILVEQLSGIPPAIPRTHKISFANNQTQFSDLNFSSNFTQCPKVEVVKDIVPEAPASLEISRVVISNYQDFREVNDQGDEGSATKSEQYQSNKKIDWTASTLTTDPQVYVQILYPNKEPENYSIAVNTEETVTNVGGVELKIKRVLPKETAQVTQSRQITKIYLASVSGDYLADLFIDGEYFDPEIDITEQSSQFKIIRCFSDLSCDDPQLAKVVNLSVETYQKAEPEQTAPQPTFSHRSCGDVSGNVIVDVYSDGSEVAGTNCEDLDKVCQVFDSEGRQDATCVEQKSLE